MVVARGNAFAGPLAVVHHCLIGLAGSKASEIGSQKFPVMLWRPKPFAPNTLTGVV